LRVPRSRSLHTRNLQLQRPIRIRLRWGLKSQDWRKINEEIKQEMIERQTTNNLVFLPLDEAANVMAVDISAGIQRALTRYPHFVMSKNDQATLQQSASKSEPGRSFRPDRKITRLNKQLKSLTKLIKHEPDKSAKEQLLKQRNLVLQDRRDAGSRTRRKKREIETVRRYTQNGWKFLESILNESKNDVKPNFTAQQAKETFEFRWKYPLKVITYTNVSTRR
jgi:hypothetical protein